MIALAVAVATSVPSALRRSPAMKPMSRPRRTTRPWPRYSPGSAGARNWICRSIVGAHCPDGSVATSAGPSVS